MSCFSPRFVLRRALMSVALLALWLPRAGAQQQPQQPQQPWSNAAPDVQQQVSAALQIFADNARAGDERALAAFGLSAGDLVGAPLRVQVQLSRLAQGESGVLARETFRAGRGDQTLSAGRHDLWMTRDAQNEWAVARVWPEPGDAAGALAGAAGDEAAKLQRDTDTVLSLVAAWRGGRWLALRRSRWNGRAFDDDTLARLRAQNAAAGRDDLETWLRAQMARLAQQHASEAGTAHFFAQRDESGWVGLDAVWQPPAASEGVNARDENAVMQARRALEGAGFLNPSWHRALGRSLARLGLWNEAADALQRANLLQPGLVSTEELGAAETARASDPQAAARAQADKEHRVGLANDYPTRVIADKLKPGLDARNETDSPLLALRLGLEYAKLADDERAFAWLNEARRLAAAGVEPSQAAWVKWLFDHLNERRRLAALKPRNVLRTALFALRCRLDDPQTLTLLAALEAAQHTVYSDFGIPMGSTEVVLWPSQRAFQAYTSHFAEAPTSEFVAAITLTKLISTNAGPMVLGEEVNAFTDGRPEIFGTVAHEYGHVAVRQLARGRTVPTWFNEGVATSVEGGYEGYIARVQAAQDAGALLSMPELQQWDVDGERAFLAYSQANSLIDFIGARGGRDSVQEILRLLGQEIDFETALRRATGFSSQSLWNAWAQSALAAPNPMP